MNLQQIREALWSLGFTDYAPGVCWSSFGCGNKLENIRLSFVSVSFLCRQIRKGWFGEREGKDEGVLQSLEQLVEFECWMLNYCRTWLTCHILEWFLKIFSLALLVSSLLHLLATFFPLFFSFQQNSSW